MIPAESEQVPDFLTPREVAAIARVSMETVWRWLREGRLPVVKLSSRTYRVRRADLEKLLTPASAAVPLAARKRAVRKRARRPKRKPRRR